MKYSIPLIAIATILIFFFIEEVRPFLPENLIELGQAQLKTTGVLIFVTLLIVALWIPKNLNHAQPNWSILSIVIVTGGILAAIEFIFKLIQGMLVGGNGNSFGGSSILMPVLLVGVFGMLVANIRIHSLRKKSILIPILLLFAVWIGGGMLIQYLG